MKWYVLVGSLVILLCFAAWSSGETAEERPRHGQHQHHEGQTPAATCHKPVHVSEDAERQPGGALYRGPAVLHHMELGNGATMPAMKGAHTDHSPKHSGAFFMAPDKIHHLEGVYSEDCGFRLYLYNAFTKPIRVGRFRAFIRIVPSSEDEADMIRFLSPNQDRTVLATPVGEPPTRPFEIQLHLKFPESDEPELFNVRVPIHPTQ